MGKKRFLILFISLFFIPSISVFAETSENKVSAILTVKVKKSMDSSDEQGTPISNARLIVINSLGKVIATQVTDTRGEAYIPVTIPLDHRFPLKNMGEVIVIAVANGYNEHINFSVPINEFNDNTGSVTIPLWRIDPNHRNEPQFLNGSFHRFTVFETLDYYAKQVGLKRQNIHNPSIDPVPWGPEMKNL